MARYDIDPLRAVTSSFLRPRIHAVLRLILGLYCVVVWISSLVDGYNRGRLAIWLFFFTNLTYSGLTLYMISAVIHTWIYAFQLRKTPYGVTMTSDPSSLPYGRWWTRVHVFLYVSVVGCHLIVPLFYWTLVYNWRHPDYMSQVTMWVTLSQHGTDFVVMVCEVIFGRMLLRRRDLALVLLIGILYMFYMWIVHAATGIWVYEVLSFDRGPIVAVWYVLVIVVSILSFGLMYGIHQLRERVAIKLGREPSVEPEQQADEKVGENV